MAVPAKLTEKQRAAVDGVIGFLETLAGVAADLRGVDFEDYDDTESAHNRGAESEAFEIGTNARAILGRLRLLKLAEPKRRRVVS